MSEADRDLIEQARTGDNRAFEALVRRYQRAVYAVALRVVGSHGEADDVAQQTFVKAYEALPKYRGDGSFKSWLLTICVNVSRNRHRSRKRIEALTDEAQIPDDRMPGPVEQLEGHERSQALRKAISRLPEKQRLAVELRIYQDLPFSEVARVIGSNVNAVKVNFHHAVKALRVLVGQEEAA